MTSLKYPSEWKLSSLTTSSAQQASRPFFGGRRRALYPFVRRLIMDAYLRCSTTEFFKLFPPATIRLGLWIGNSSIRLGMIQRPHPALVRCPLRVGDIERRVYQLAASYGVQTGRPLSPHSTPTNTPGCTPPPTPRPR